MPAPTGQPVMDVTLFVAEGRQHQGTKAKIAYTVLTTPLGGTPAGVVIKVFDVTERNQYQDVTSVVMPSGSASVAGDIITLPLLQLLTAWHLYWVEVLWTFGGNTFVRFIEVQAGR